MERLYTDYVLPAFEKANDVKVVVVPGTSSDILAKVQASKDKPQMHVMFLDDGVMYARHQHGPVPEARRRPILAQISARAA